MPVEANCPGCAKLLRVGDEHAGRDARCPECQTIVRMPEHAAPAPAAPEKPGAEEPAAEVVSAELASEPDRSLWQMKTPEGQTYGPVGRAELARWVAEGRVTHDCQLCADEGAWQSADAVFPVLSLPPARLTPPPGAPGNSVRPVSAGRTLLAPHRGPVILALALLGFVSGCAILSIMAWVMANGDLAEMREGRMDPEGQSLTLAGYWLGMVLSLAWILAAVVGMLVVLVVVINK